MKRTVRCEAERERSMREIPQRRMRDRVGVVLALAVSACGDSRPANTTAEPNTPPERRLVCPSCAAWTGGETSDFGEGEVPTGEGIHADPTPCELSTQTSVIDEAAARELGFGSGLDQLVTSFDLPLEWEPGDGDDLGGGGPAQGYLATSNLRGTTRIAELRHRAPTLAGCDDSIFAILSTSLETADGSLAIEGSVGAHVFRAADGISAHGALDLEGAHGNLEIFPPASDAVLLGQLQLFLYFWPGSVRAFTRVQVVAVEEIGSDSPSYVYTPLEGRAPVDSCDIHRRPVAVDAPIFDPPVTLAGAYAGLKGRVAPALPLPARWRSGDDATVEVLPGDPFDVCQDDIGVSFRVPYEVISSDGRVNVRGDARASFGRAAGAWTQGWFEIYPDIVETVEQFADRTGISGVDFRSLGGARWHTVIRFNVEGEPEPTGNVTVEGVDVDGSVTGIEGAVDGVLDQLSW